MGRQLAFCWLYARADKRCRASHYNFILIYDCFVLFEVSMALWVSEMRRWILKCKSSFIEKEGFWSKQCGLL